MTPTLTAVPVAPADRWRPIRAGLVSVWRYVEETFEFHRGRLLLRGPNGSGKSMALELLLPFLLDADASPSRLTSAAKSRGGLFDRVMTGSDEPSRTGYAWVEFRRDGECFTVGARMRASQASRPKVDVDYFTTTLTVGESLHLIDHQRIPLSLKDLRSAIGDHGRVHASGDDHRKAVRETLYEGFGADRYASVVTALLALRKEKLSQNLDLDKLSDVLSDALPPIDDHDIAAIAEGFERLDRRRAQIEALRVDLAEVDSLNARQRAYARSVVAWLADEVRSAESVRDTVTRRAREASERLEDECRRLGVHDEQTSALEASTRDAGIEIDVLVRSEAYTAGANLADLREQLGKLDATVGRSQVTFDKAEANAQEAQVRRDESTVKRDVVAGNLDDALGDLRHRASEMDAHGMVDDAVDLASALESSDESEALARAYTSARRAAIDELRRLLDDHRETVQQRDFRHEHVEAEISRLDDAAAVVATARAEAVATVDRYAATVGEWATSCATIDPQRLTSELPQPPSEPGGVDSAIARLRSSLATEHAVTLQRLQGEQGQLDAEHADLEVERLRYASGTIVEPDRPAWRDHRDGRAGAPLWRLVDTKPGVTPDVLRT